MNQLDDLYEPNWENTANKLMEYHVEALFVHDQHSRLLTINENLGPTVPAPAFFLGRTIDGKAVCRFRYDCSRQDCYAFTRVVFRRAFHKRVPHKAKVLCRIHGSPSWATIYNGTVLFCP